MCYNINTVKKYKTEREDLKMELVNKIHADIKNAMIAHDNETRDTLRMVLGNAQMVAKEAHVEVADTHMLSALQKEIKQTHQALDILKQNGQESGEFYDKNIRRLAVLEKYMPKAMSEDEIAARIRELIAGIDTSNKGLVMKTVMTDMKGKADGKLINSIVMKVIANK